MTRYWKFLGEYDAETSTWSAFAGAAGASPYTPTANGRLVGIRVLVAATAATTLFEAAQFRLTCDKFIPNAIESGAVGGGLRSAPAIPIPEIDWVVDQEVQAGVPITLEGRNLAGTPVTVQCFLFGLFES